MQKKPCQRNFDKQKTLGICKGMRWNVCPLFFGGHLISLRITTRNACKIETFVNLSIQLVNMVLRKFNKLIALYFFGNVRFFFFSFLSVTRNGVCFLLALVMVFGITSAPCLKSTRDLDDPRYDQVLAKRFYSHVILKKKKQNSNRIDLIMTQNP